MNWDGFQTKDDVDFVQLFEGLCVASRMASPSVGEEAQA